MSRLSFILFAGVATLGLFVIGFTLGYRAEIGRITAQGEAGLELSVDRLTNQLDRYRYLPSVLARNTEFRDLLTAPHPARIAQLNRRLERIADTSGALDIYVMDADGLTVATSNHALERSFLGRNFSWRPYFKQAMLGRLASYHAVGTTSRARGFYFAHPIRGSDFAPIGVIVVKVDLERIERAWRGDRDTVFFTDGKGVVFLSNRDVLVLRRTGPPPSVTGADSLQYAGIEPLPLPISPDRNLFGQQVWTYSGDGFVPARAIDLSRRMEVIGFDAHILADESPARAQAMLWGALSGAFGGVLSLIGAVVFQRRQALAAQLVAEEQAKIELEGKVARRTADLSKANERLKAEVQEREAAEKSLRQVQDELVQAGKLTALGQMSAGISHELNQPLTAIQTLAENASILSERGETEQVRQNISRISQIAGRMGRIIKNLRTFARKEGEPVEDVDLIEVIADTLALAEGRFHKEQVTLHWTPPEHAVFVRGGPVRLQQVVMNLITNALDAMEGLKPGPVLELAVSAQADRVHLDVRDHGPGLSEPDRIFDPFYSTKPVSGGMGLGLSISYGIVQSFGGRISGRNHEGGGAVLTVDLTRSNRREAAA